MSSEQKYLEALKQRAKAILDEEETELKPTKAKGKKQMDDETKARVLENLKKGREKAAEVRNIKKQIKDKEKEEKVKEFEELKAKYNITSAKSKDIDQEKPKRERATDIPPYKEEKEPETIKQPLEEKTKPIDIPKPEIKQEKPIETIQNSIPATPTIQKPRYFKPTLAFVKSYGNLYN